MKIKSEIIKSIIDIQNRHKALVDKLSNIYMLLDVTNEHLITYKNQLDNIDTSQNLKTKQSLYDILLKYEAEINKLNDETKPYLEEMESLKTTSTSLYLKIKELFPNTDDDTIKSYLYEDIHEYKALNNID